MNITNIMGIGPKTAKTLNKLNIFTVEDLITYYPYKYNVYSFSHFTFLEENSIINVTIETTPIVRYIKPKFNILTFNVNENNNVFNVIIYNRAFLKPNLTINKRVTLIGKYDMKKKAFIASDIKFNIKNGEIEPVYHLTRGLSNQMIHKYIENALKYSCDDYIPTEYKDDYDFINKNEALSKIHCPLTALDVKNAKIRLIYEELFVFTFKMNFLRMINKDDKGVEHLFSQNKVIDLIKSLPFNLTDDQNNALKEVLHDIQSKRKMNRIILGDVGSGKTIISTIAAYANVISGYQVALMAPTEILACQHYDSISKVLEKFNVNIGIISGSMSVKEKKQIYEKTKNGEIDLLIGTHALLNEDVVFNKLGLVITDEQHRFGVRQRDILQKKAYEPDILYLSATPIPRTYALTIYGDLDISMIKTKPMGRKEIITKLKSEQEIKDVLTNMLEEIKKGHQIYIVSPLVEQNDNLDLSSVEYLKEKIDIAFKNKVRSEIIHGKLKQIHKDKIMNDFKNNDVKILISTTVIEVGIDVPNATMMIIFNAERFGLATLHQLRGRVGRNSLQSYCYLISNYDIKRLKVMEDSNDGFYISEKDFEIRGHGDLFGTKQSGDMIFKLANLKKDYQILVQAKKDSEKFINSKKYLEYPYYKELSMKLDIAD